MKNPKAFIIAFLICIFLLTYFYSQKKMERVMNERAQTEMMREVTDSLNYQTEIEMECSGEDNVN